MQCYRFTSCSAVKSCERVLHLYVGDLLCSPGPHRVFSYSATPHNAHTILKNIKERSTNENTFLCMKTTCAELRQYSQSIMSQSVSCCDHRLWNPPDIRLKFNFTYIFDCVCIDQKLRGRCNIWKVKSSLSFKKNTYGISTFDNFWFSTSKTASASFPVDTQQRPMEMES